MSEQPATESLSIEDRIANAFEPEQPEVEAQPEQQEAEAPESEASPEFAEVEYEGKSYQVPPEIKDALLRQSDYTRKTTEAAERTRALEQKELEHRFVEDRRKFDDAVKDDVSQLQELDWTYKQLKAIPASTLSESEYRDLRDRLEGIKDKKAEISNGLNAKWDNFQRQQQTMRQEATVKAKDYITKAIKNWGPETERAVREHALSEGYTAPELDALADPRLVKTLWKAQQFDKLQKSTLDGRVKSAPTVKPGSSNPMPQNVKDQFALKKTLSNKSLNSNQKAKAIEAEMMKRF